MAEILKRKFDEIENESEQDDDRKISERGAGPSDSVTTVVNSALQKEIEKIERLFIDPVARAKREKYWIKKLTILLSETEMKEFNTNKHNKWKYDSIRTATNKSFQPVDPNKGKEKTISMVIQMFNERKYNERTDFLNGVPYALDSKKQTDFWEAQNKEKISPRFRKILIQLPDNQPDKYSPSYNKMQQRSISSENLVKNKKAGNDKNSEAQIGHDQRNALEACAIFLLVQLFELHITDFKTNYKTYYAFDGLQTDFFIRKHTWPADQFVSLQMKSAQVKFGKPTFYFLKPNQYDDSIYCVGAGIQNYEKNETPTDFNDVSCDGATIFEFFNIGKSQNLLPTPGVSYASLENQRIYVSHANLKNEFADPKPFLENMLDKFETWPKHTFEEIMFRDVGDKMTPECKTEKLGLEALNTILSRFGSKLCAPRRQNETVDTYFTKIGGTNVAISNKTSSIINGDPKQRRFPLNTAPNSNFCDVVIAWYQDQPSKFAVIPADVVYTSGLQNYCWNETSLSPNVRIFDTSEEDGLALFNYLCTFKTF